MVFDFNKDEINILVSALKESAANCNTFISKAEHQGYSSEAIDSESQRLLEIWDLVERIEKLDYRRRKPIGSTGAIDPYDLTNED